MNRHTSFPSRTLCLMSVVGLLGGCASDRPLRTPDVIATAKAQMQDATARPQTPASPPENIIQALAEPTAAATTAPREPRLDLLVNNAQAREVFLAIVADTRYSMLMHPDVKGTLSVTLRGVTVVEALEAIRDVYGYDFKIEGRRIVVYAPSIQTRIFALNYPNSQRVGNSDLRVTSGVGVQSDGGTGAGSSGSTSGSGGSGTGGATQQHEGARVSTSSKTDFWGEMVAAVKGLVGTGVGRNVIASPQAGIIAVTAMPDELQQVDKFLKAAQISVERQVMLEAKIVEVELRDGYQSGVNWSALTASSDGSLQLGVGTAVTATGAKTLIGDAVTLPAIATGTGVFGLALATSKFSSVLGFLETQGDVQTLSNPRVATLNNQKAVLKVGEDNYFVTAITGSSNNTTSGSGTTTTQNSPTVTLTPFFSGISLDVMPQIDDSNNVTLHVHPTVATVSEISKDIDLGSAGTYRLPVASSNVNETDTLVRIQDGNIVAIGGLMQLESSKQASGLPGTTRMGGLSALFGNRANSGRKKEVIVLLKPTIIRTASDWAAQTELARQALDDMEADRARVIKIDGSAQGGTPSP